MTTDASSESNPQAQVSLELLEHFIANKITARAHLDSMTLLVCEGEDAATFLQGQLTCDVTCISEETTPYGESQSFEAVLGSCCTPQGRMMGLFHVAKVHAECFWIILTQDNQPTVSKHLGKYSVFSKVTITENPDQLQINGLIQPILGGEPTTQNSATLIKTNTGENADYQLIYEILPGSSKAGNAGKTFNAQKDLWQLAWLCRGLPQFWQSLEGAYMPSDLHLDELDGVSYNKGCYTGQEPIARLHFKGVPKFTCRVLSWKIESTSLGPVFLGEKKVGELIQALRLDTHWIGLVRVRIDALKAHVDSPTVTFHLENHSEPASFLNLAYNQRKQAQMIEA